MTQPNPLAQAHTIGQSIWIDFIQRSMIDSGDLAAMIERDRIRGLTSNPAIFEAAIAKTDEYDAALADIIKANPGISDLEAFNALAIADIQAAADVFTTTYEESGGEDGMVSLEVPPELAHDAEATVTTALDLHQRLARKNVMIKVPGTSAGVSAFEQLTAAGINVNVTLLFSVSRYREIAQAYIRGLEQRAARGEAIDNIASVASFFVSRVDSAVDALLEKQPEAESLLGQTGIANAKVAYGYFANIFGSEQWQQLAAKGARPQRLLWASTGTKNPAYGDVYYVEELMGPNTVNTVPPKTMDAFRDHGVAENRLAKGLDVAHRALSSLPDHGVNLAEITQKLEADGVQSFTDAFTRLLASIAEKRSHLAA